MTNECKKTIEELIKHFGYKCTVKNFRSCKGKSWSAMSACGFLSWDFILQFEDRIYWKNLLCNQKISENLFDKIVVSKQKYFDEVHISFKPRRLTWIFKYQSISNKFLENFIEKYYENMKKYQWEAVLDCQNVSIDFLKKHWDKINKHVNRKKYYHILHFVLIDMQKEAFFEIVLD